jgi:hypothetical protein
MDRFAGGGRTVSYQLDTYTEQLLDIIQILQMQRATGVLQVRRGEGITVEEGRIVFANGQTSDARAGRRVGPEAVSWITSWPMCWVRFLSDDPTFSLEKVLRMIGQSSGKHAPRQQDTPIAGAYTPIPEARPISPLRKQRNTADSMQSGYLSSNNTRPSGPLSAGHPSGPLPLTSAELIIPTLRVRLDVALRALEASGLSRAHRQVLLLIDGKRPIGELIRLTRRERDDVYKLLQDLEQIRVIQLIPG